LTNYLHDRQQYSVVEGYKSNVQNINRGVPQDSTLGPPLFAFYINDLPKVSRFRTTMFADDTLLTISSNNPQQLNTLANAELQKINNWMRINKLSLNYKKTTFMIIKCDPKPVTSFSINIGNNQIAQTNCTKYLGVILDDKLSWYQLITNLEDKLTRSLGIFYMTRHYLTPSALKSVYFCLVYSHLQYAIGAWGSMPKTTLNYFNVLHNKPI